MAAAGAGSSPTARLAGRAGGCSARRPTTPLRWRPRCPARVRPPSPGTLARAMVLGATPPVIRAAASGAAATSPKRQARPSHGPRAQDI